MTLGLQERIAALSRAEPALADDLRLRGVLIVVLDGAHVEAPSLVIPAERVRAKLERGISLLDGEAIAIPPGLGLVFERLAVAWLACPESGGSVEALLTAVRGGALHGEQVLSEALAGHADHLESLAESVSVSPALLEALADLAVRPLLVRLAERLRPALNLKAWDRGYCPVCGAWPLCAIDETGHARLLCGRCLASWSWPSTRCPFEPRGQLIVVDSLTLDTSERWSVARCDSCQHYLKMSSLKEPGTLGNLMVSDLASWQLDRAAIERGLGRPAGLGYRLELEHLDDGADETFDDG
jgi:FdhE protein